MTGRIILLAVLLAPGYALAQKASGEPMAPGSITIDPTEAALTNGTLVGLPMRPVQNTQATSAPNQAVGGGIVPSSSRARAPGETDHFDLRRGAGGGGTARGGKDGPIFLERLDRRPAVGAAAGEAPARPSTVTVQKGDSLWAICERELGNAYAWPKVWALNPTIENPHLIEPGLQVRLRAESEEGDGAGGGGGGRAGLRAGSAQTAGKGDSYALRGRERTVEGTSIFQLDEGLVEDGDGAVRAEIHGSPSDHLYLAAGDEVWVRPLDGTPKLAVGQMLVVHRPVRKTSVGDLVHIVGTIKVTSVRDGYALARANVVEATDVIERGMRLSSEPRELRVVAPRQDAPDLEARILGATHLHAFYGQHQVVFIDRGVSDNLQPGHTLYVERAGDGLASSTASREARTTVGLDSETPADARTTAQAEEGETLPAARVAELRVVSVKPHSATCVVLRSRREIETTDVARTGAAP